MTRVQTKGKQNHSLASFSIEKMYKQTYFDESGMAQIETAEFKPSISNFKMPNLSS